MRFDFLITQVLVPYSVLYNKITISTYFHKCRPGYVIPIESVQNQVIRNFAMLTLVSIFATSWYAYTEFLCKSYASSRYAVICTSLLSHVMCTLIFSTIRFSLHHMHSTTPVIIITVYSVFPFML